VQLRPTPTIFPLLHQLGNTLLSYPATEPAAPTHTSGANPPALLDRVRHTCLARHRSVSRTSITSGIIRRATCR